MNFVDSDILASIMLSYDYSISNNINDADIILLNTCSIRNNAEERIKKRLRELRFLKKKNRLLLIGIVGCMAERLKEQLLEEGDVDIVVGPDAYRSLPALLSSMNNNDKIINVELSEEETYSDIKPVRLSSNGVSAFIAIMRGCENYCSYCVVPYTRGAERSRPPESIINEATELFNNGYKEISLLGQNVNSYLWKEGDTVIDFPDILKMVANINPLLRVRFATSHPKDISDKLIQVIASTHNICKSIHLPVQSGNNRILNLMNRNYTREYYLERIATIRKNIPDCSVSTDIIAGFCTETEEEHKDTLSLMDLAVYDNAFMFMYSGREGTYAARYLDDNVPEHIKKRRLNEIIEKQRKLSVFNNKKEIGTVQEVLIEGKSKRESEYLSGRTSKNKVVVFPAEGYSPGEYVNIEITACTSATLIGKIIKHI